MQLKTVAPDETYNVGKHAESAALTVSGGTVTVSVTLTSPIMREATKAAAPAGNSIVSFVDTGQEKDNRNMCASFNRRENMGFSFPFAFIIRYTLSVNIRTSHLLIRFGFSLFFSWPGKGILVTFLSKIQVSGSFFTVPRTIGGERSPVCVCVHTLRSII